MKRSVFADLVGPRQEITVKMPEKTTLQLHRIRRDGGTQSRESIDKATVKEYRELLDNKVELPPVVVFFDLTTYWLVDGFHRVEAHEEAGRKTIAVEVHEGSQRDAVFHSLSVNARHGLRRSNADKRRAVMTALRDPEWSKLSGRKIAEICAVDEGTVRNCKDELAGTKRKPGAEVPQQKAKEEPAAPAPRTPTTRVEYDREPDAKEEQVLYRCAVCSSDINPGQVHCPNPECGEHVADAKLTCSKCGGSLMKAKMPVRVPSGQAEKSAEPFWAQGGKEGGRKDWCTPPEVVEVVRQVGGGVIGLDPCSNPQSVVGAKLDYQVERGEDGLAHSWRGHGLVFINPPFGKDEIPPWTKKAVEEFTSGDLGDDACLFLVPANTDVKWFHRDLIQAAALCFWKGRIEFIGGEHGATFPVVFAFFGAHPERFRAAFEAHGWVVELERVEQAAAPAEAVA